MRAPILLAAALLAGCGSDTSPEEQAMLDRRDVALVEKTNQAPPPLEQITPDAIGFPDIERYDLKGAACNYAPGTSLGTRVIAREADAFLKIDGVVERLAADSGARELPQRTRSMYTGKTYELRLDLRGEGTPDESGRSNFEGTVTLRDKHGRVVYNGTGFAQCIPGYNVGG